MLPEKPLKVEIRWMVEADVSQVVAIENCWDYLSKWGEEGYLRVLREPYVYCPLVAEVESDGGPSPGETGILAGLAVLALMVDHGELCNLIVTPQCLGKRVGQRLLAGCLEVARQRQLTRIFLEVRHSNSRAIRFYRRNGFQIVSRRGNYYRDPLEDAWVMERAAARGPLPTGASGVLKGMGALRR